MTFLNPASPDFSPLHRLLLLLTLAVGCTSSGCWNEVEYDAAEPTAAADQNSTTAADQTTGESEPATSDASTDLIPDDDAKAAAGEFGEDLAASLSADEPSVSTASPGETTPFDEPGLNESPADSGRYAASGTTESTSTEDTTTTDGTASDLLFGDPPAETNETHETNASSESTQPADTAEATAASEGTVDALFGEPADSNAPPDSPVNDSMLPEEREAIAESSDVPIPNVDDDEIQTPPAVAAWNARRATWLLGSKLSLAALANEHGAPALEVQQWFGQSSALAEKMGLTLKDLPARPAVGAAPAASDAGLDYLFTEGQVIGSELSDRSGADYAALFEVAVKSNILLVLYKPGSPTTVAIADAIERAGERSKLPETLWRPLLETLAAKASLAEVREAVWHLHGETDKYLDETPPQ